MKHITFTLLLSLLLCLCASAETLTGKVVRIADGDTFTLLVNKKQHRIRLHGIDAPETKGGQPYSQKYNDYLASMIAGRTVTVDVRDTDRYGRYIGVVSTSSVKDVNLKMFKAGMAWHYSHYDKTPAYKRHMTRPESHAPDCGRTPLPSIPMTGGKSIRI